MGQVVAARGDQGHSRAASRDDDQGRIENRQAHQQGGEQERGDTEPMAVAGDHGAPRDEEPDRQAPAVAEEDPRRARQVVGEEADAGAGDGEGEGGQHGVAVNQGERADPGGRDARHGARSAVEVVHQVEGVAQADDPGDGEQEVEALGTDHGPAQTGGGQRAARADLRQHAPARCHRNPIVERAQGQHGCGTGKEDPVTPGGVAERQRPRRESREHRQPPEVGGRRAVLLVAGGMVVELRATGERR